MAMYNKYKTDVLPLIVDKPELRNKINKYFDEQWFSPRWRKTWLNYYRILKNIDTRLTTGNAPERFHIHFMRHMCNFRIQPSFAMLLARVFGVSICGLTVLRTLPVLWSLRRRDLNSQMPPALQRNTRQRLRDAQSHIIGVRANIGFGDHGDHVAVRLRSLSGGGVWAVRKSMAPLQVTITQVYVSAAVTTLRSIATLSVYPSWV